MSYAPHPADEPLVRRPAREDKKGSDQDEKNRSSDLTPGGQGSDLPGLREAPAPELDAGSPSRSMAHGNAEEPPRNLRQTLHDYQIEPGLTAEESRRQLEQNIVAQENTP